MQRTLLCLVLFSIGSLVLGCGGGSPMQDTIAENRRVIEQLPPGDREAALEQWSCLVCGEMLGSQGPPVKAEIGSETRFFCSQGCADQASADPAGLESATTQ